MFKRKGEGNAQDVEPVEPAVDLSPLSAEGGFSAGEGPAIKEITEPIGSPVDSVAAGVEPVIERARPVEAAAPRRKRYYSPSEVRRRKGCIGCGGMVLAVPFLVTVIGTAVALF